MLAAQQAEPFDSPDWIFELDTGGVRSMAVFDGGSVVLQGQNGADLTPIYPELRAIAGQIDLRQAVVDGEIVAMGKNGAPDFSRLRPRLHALLQPRHPRFPPGPLHYVAADLLYADGTPLVGLPLRERKNLLHALLRPSPLFQACEFIEGDGVAFYEAVSRHRLEGVVAKRKESPYRPGERSPDWVRIPAARSASLVIGGYTFGGRSKKEAFSSLLLGVFQGRDLVYAGRAASSLSAAEAWRTVRLLEGLHTADCPFTQPPRVTALTFWCRPALAGQFRVGEPAPDGTFRFAVFMALRPDISPEDCLLEPAG